MADETAASVSEEIPLNGVVEVGSSSASSRDAESSREYCDGSDTTSDTASPHCDSSNPTTATACCDPSLSTPHCDPRTSHCDFSSHLATPHCDVDHPLAVHCDIGDPCDADHLTAEGSGNAGRPVSGPGGKDEGVGGGKKLQKADSGIEVEKSPSVSVREVLSDAEGGDSVSECCLDSMGLSHSESFKSDHSHGQVEDDIGIDSSILDSSVGVDSSVLDSNAGVGSSALESNAGISSSIIDSNVDIDSSIVNGNFGVDSSFLDSNTGVDSSVLDSTFLPAHASPPDVDAIMRDQGQGTVTILRTDDDPSDVHMTEDGRQIIDDVEEREEETTDMEGENRCLANDYYREEDDEDDEEAATGTDGRSAKYEHKDEEEMEVNNNPWPPHKWRVVPDLRAREIGVTGCTPPSLFREKVQGSLYMVERLKLQYRMEHHEGCVNSLHFNRIGTLLASGADDLQIVLWNWARNRKALVYDSGHRSNVFQAKFMPYSGDCHVVSCARDGQVRLSELSLTGVCKNTKKLAQHKGVAHKLALEYDSPHVFLSCGEDALTFQIDLREDRPQKLIVTKENDRKVALYSIHSNPVNPYEFLTSGRDPYVRIYDKRKINESVNKGIVKKYCPKHLDNGSPKTNVTCACYSYNGSEIVGSYNDEDIYVFDNLTSDSTDAVHRYVGHRNNATVKGVSFYGPRSEYVVTGSDCGHVFIWDKETEHIVQFLDADRGGVVNVLEPHPFAPVLATSGLDHDVKIWAPISHDPPKLEGLEMQKRKNRRDRQLENEHAQEPEMIDGQMVWFIMNHFRRSARRRLREGGEDVSSSSNSSDSDDDDNDDDDSDAGDHGGPPDNMQCQAS